MKIGVSVPPVTGSLDYFSGGRFIFGIGAGWHREETEIMGGDFPHRWSQVREAVLAMKEIWTKDEAEFHGRYYDFPWCGPIPSRPRSPIRLCCWGGVRRTCSAGWWPGETAGCPPVWPSRRGRYGPEGGGSGLRVHLGAGAPHNALEVHFPLSPHRRD